MPNCCSKINLLCLLCIAFIFYVSFGSSTNAIRYPVTPQEPNSPKLEAPKGDTTSSSTKEQKIEKTAIQIKALLGSGDELNGTIQAPQELKFKHYRNGFIYRKKIQTNDISSIEITSFQKNLIRTEKSQKFYEF